MTEDADQEAVAAAEHLNGLLHCLRSVTLPLVTLNYARTFPRRMASGFIIPCRDRYFLISAAHAIASDEWFIEWDAARDQKTPAVMIPLHATWSVNAQFDLEHQTLGKVDFAWAEVNPQGLADWLKAQPQLEGKPIAVPSCYKGPLDTLPTPEALYAYSAFNRAVAEDHRTVRLIERSESLVSCLLSPCH